MKVQITRGTFVRGELAEAGSIVECSEKDANLLKAMNKAIDAQASKPKRKTVTEDV